MQAFAGEAFDGLGIFEGLEAGTVLVRELQLLLHEILEIQNFPPPPLVLLDRGQVPKHDANQRRRPQQKENQPVESIPDAQVNFHARRQARMGRRMKPKFCQRRVRRDPRLLL